MSLVYYFRDSAVDAQEVKVQNYYVFQKVEKKKVERNKPIDPKESANKVGTLDMIQISLSLFLLSKNIRVHSMCICQYKV